VTPALDHLRVAKPWYLRGPAAWKPRPARLRAAALRGAMNQS
jgi:hypothetical protein